MELPFLYHWITILVEPVAENIAQENVIKPANYVLLSWVAIGPDVYHRFYQKIPVYIWGLTLNVFYVHSCCIVFHFILQIKNSAGIMCLGAVVIYRLMPFICSFSACIF